MLQKNQPPDIMLQNCRQVQQLLILICFKMQMMGELQNPEIIVLQAFIE